MQSFPSEQSQDRQGREGGCAGRWEAPPIHNSPNFRVEAEPRFPEKEWELCFRVQGCLLAGRDDLLFKFWHAWLSTELVVISQDGRKKPSRIREESSDTSSAHHKREDVGDKGHKDDMQSMESHIEGLGTNSLSRASRNKGPVVKIKPQS